MFFVEEEGTASSFQAMAEVIEIHGLPSSLYTDRGSHYWIIPEAGGKVDRLHRTQFGRAMHPLGVERIPAYSPQAAWTMRADVRDPPGAPAQGARRSGHPHDATGARRLVHTLAPLAHKLHRTHNQSEGTGQPL